MSDSFCLSSVYSILFRNRLSETEHAHETAMEELQKVTAIQREIAEQRDLMLQEISSIMPTTDEVLDNVSSPLSVA